MATKIIMDNNTIDATAMQRGYSSWWMAPDGSPVSPPNQKSPDTTGRFATLNANKDDGSTDIYEPKGFKAFSGGEEITLTGPENGIITLKDEKGNILSLQLQPTEDSDQEI